MLCIDSMNLERLSKTARIKAGWLVDGTGSPARRDMLLTVEEGRFIAIKHDDHHQIMNKNILDFSFYTIIPMLLDCHAHLFLSGIDNINERKKQINAKYSEIIPTIEKHIKNHLSCGVIAVRDGGDWAGHTLRFKMENRLPLDVPVHLMAAGRAWHAPGRYGRIMGRPPLEGMDLAGSILKEKPGMDHVKVINSGINSLTTFGNQTRPQFLPVDLQRAIKEANKMGLPVMAHANGKEPVQQSLMAGCSSIEHGFFMGRESLLKMAELGITWVPTACTMSAYARALPKGAKEAEVAQKNLEHQLDQIRIGMGLGVSMAVGTDSGSLGVHHGFSVSEEISLFIEAGMSVEGAIRCATLNGARLLGLENCCGTIKSGMPATFIVLEGRPENIINSIKTPFKIYINHD